MRDFAAIVREAQARGAQTVVEIGSIRSDDLAHVRGDGHATLVWVASFARVFSYDIDPQATWITRRLAGDRGNLTAETMDGIAALRQFPDPIDLLYLDGWDIGAPDYQQRHLEAFQAAEPRLHDRSLVLVDDVEFPNHGKAGAILPYARERGWSAVPIGKQMLLTRTSAGEGEATV